MPKVRICLIEDDPVLGEALEERLRHEGFDPTLHPSPSAGIAQLQTEKMDLLVCDIRLPEMSGEELFSELGRNGIATPVLFITGYGTIDQAVRLLRRGALDYLTKPLDIDRLIDRIHSATTHDRFGVVDEQLGISSAMRSLRHTIDRLVPRSELVVLIEGESGTGKEVVARLIHDLSSPNAPFEAVNCAAIPADLVTSILFGHEKGAFTSADHHFPGAFERAGSGVLFLDEIGDMPPQIQVQLLRVIEELTFQPLGSAVKRRVECRIVCATHQDLEGRVREGSFREDLFYRLGVVRLKIPALRDRREDILWLAEKFLADNAARVGRRPITLTDSAKEALLAYEWLGNVRELKNLIDRACLFCDGDTLDAERIGLPRPEPGRLRDTMEQSEAERIRRELAVHQGRIQATADALGISRKSLWQKMKRLNIRK